jgi:type IV pilus assembly protein PilB
MQVNLKAGVTFETGLRAILRQDPDVFMVGETRDKETASISVRAAITGHLVLSSLHTNDAASSITRLIDMEIPRYMLSASLIGIVAQRLVRMVCSICTEAVSIDRYKREQTQDFSFLPAEIKEIRRGKGCPVCNSTGYKGRQAVHEIMAVNNTIRGMINDPTVLTGDIKAYSWRETGMKTLEEGVIGLIENGLTTPEEYVRVISTITYE